MSETNPYAPQSVAKVEKPEVKESELVPSGTIPEVLDWVGDDKDRASAALDVEKNGAKRVTLIATLEDKLNK